jgi:hypothetical protein
VPRNTRDRLGLDQNIVERHDRNVDHFVRLGVGRHAVAVE